ncbi:MAG: glycosyltransferase family 9 protein [Rhodopila sp.]|nr:glycosyltransferase family 9 protein [Rhodopila sp.]
MDDSAPLTLSRIARLMYWEARRHRKYLLHLAALLCSLIKNAAVLWLRRIFSHRRRLVAIALVEHMGDIVAGEPIAGLARRRFPDARIYWITRAPYASLPASYPAMDRVLTVVCLTEWILLQRLKPFDVVWDLHINGRHCPRCGIPQVKPGNLPEIDDFYDYGCLLTVECLCAGLPVLTDGPVITPPPAAVAMVDALSLPSRFIVIHCTSNDSRRDWSADKWRELAARILAADPTVNIVEVGLRPLVVMRDGARQRTLCGALTMLETAEVIRRARLFIGIDSGPAHLANAVGTRGVILLGVLLRFRTYTPYSGDYAAGAAAAIIHADRPVAELPVETAFAAVMAHGP